MTLRIRELSKMPADTAELGRKLLKEDDPYRVIGDRLSDIVRDEDFATMYAETGRDAVWPSLLAMVTLFQFQEDIPDREAAEMVVKRLDWKYALHLSLDYAGFHFTDLHNFRERLIESEQEALVFPGQDRRQVVGQDSGLGLSEETGQTADRFDARYWGGAQAVAVGIGDGDAAGDTARHQGI